MKAAQIYTRCIKPRPQKECLDMDGKILRIAKKYSKEIQACYTKKLDALLTMDYMDFLSVIEQNT